MFWKINLIGELFMDWIEIIGIVASVLVLVSFLMKDILIIRLINITGSIVFIVYGVLIHAFATWFVNAALMVVHIFYIIKELREKRKNKQSQTTKQQDISIEE